MKFLLAATAAVLLFSACAQGGSGSGSSSGAGTGSITMYGTIDEGITVHK
jgi:ABC-type glycerol-3-phosphate transport system substrate-binding protein